MGQFLKIPIFINNLWVFLVFIIYHISCGYYIRMWGTVPSCLGSWNHLRFCVNFRSLVSVKTEGGRHYMESVYYPVHYIFLCGYDKTPLSKQLMEGGVYLFLWSQRDKTHQGKEE